MIDFSKIDYLILNEIEGNEISGEKGVIYQDRNQIFKQDIYKVNVVDTTAAGDTFLGYFLSILFRKNDIQHVLDIASIAVSRKGASSSTPNYDEL